MSFSLKEVALIAPFQISTLTMIMAVGAATDYPEHTAELVTLPATGMILGAALIAGIGYTRVRRERNEEKKFAGEVQRFIAGEI